MANKKEFEIKINGLEESARAAQTLAEQLAEVAQNGQSINQSLNINVRGNAQQATQQILDNVEQIKKTKIVVDVNGVTQEFNNVKQALKAIKDEMVNLEIAGEENTDAYRELADVYRDLALRADDAQQAVGLLATHTPELQNMLSIFKGFTAMATVGQGISNLLGIDNDEVQESIEKMTSLIGVLEGLSKLQEEINSASAFGKMFQTINDGLTRVNSRVVSGVQNLRSYISNLLGIRSSGQAAAQGLASAGAAGQQASTGLAAAGSGARTAAAGINVMKAASRTFWLFALIEAVMKLAEWLGKAGKAMYSWATGANDAAKASDIFKNKIDTLASSTERFNKIVDSMQSRGLINVFDALSLKSEKSKKNIEQLVNEIERLNGQNISGFVKSMSDIDSFLSGGTQDTQSFWQSIEDGFSSIVDSAEKAMDAVDEFGDKYLGIAKPVKMPPIDFSEWDKVEKKYEDVSKRVVNGELKAQNELANIQKGIIDEYYKRFKAVDKTSEESIRSFQEWADESNALNESLANLDKLFDSKNGEQYRELIRQIGIEMSNLVGYADQAAIEIQNIQQKTIDNNIAAMKSGNAKRLKEIQNATDKELKEYNLQRDKIVQGDKDLEALRLSILAKEQREIKDTYTQGGDEIYQIQKRIRDNNLYAEKKGYALRLAQLKNAMADELKEAQRSGKLVKEQELSIRKKYNQMIVDEERKHLKTIQNLYQEQSRRTALDEIAQLEAYLQNQQTFVEGFFDRLSIPDKIKDVDKELNKFKEDLRGLSTVEVFNEKMGGFSEMIDTFNDVDVALKELRKQIDSMYTSFENKKFFDALFDTQPAIGSMDDVRSMVDRFIKEVNKNAEVINKNDFNFFDDNFFNELENNFKKLDENYRSLQTRLEQGFVFPSDEQIKLVNERFEKLYEDLEHKAYKYSDKDYKDKKAALDTEYKLLQNAHIRQLDMEQQYANISANLNKAKYNTILNIQQSMISKEQDNLVVQENQRYQDSLKSFREQVETLKTYDESKEFEVTRHNLEVEKLERMYKEGTVKTEKQYNQLIEAEKKKHNEELKKIDDDFYNNKDQEVRQRHLDDVKAYNEYEANEMRIHQEKLFSILEQSRQKMIILEQQYNQRLEEDRNQSVNAQIKAFSDLHNAIQEEISKITIVPNNDLMRFLQIGDIVQYKNAWESAANDIDVAIQKIDFDLKKLSEVDLNGLSEENKAKTKELIQYLQQMKKQLNKQLKGMGIKDMWLSIYNECLDSYKSIADAFVGQLSSLLSTLNETALQLIDNQLEHINHELEIQQEAYDRAEECAEKHKDKMDSIEDELSSSRGARREQLIDNLMQQEKAYLDDLAAQQHAAQEKEKLEKQQAALEKKRKEQEKKSKIQQAIINTFTAVSNALSVQPWFLGLALSAAALGIGMANVAAIKSTPIYKDGGVIQGKSHKQGGVKVLGGRAEVEGGEFITNKITTIKNLPLLTYVNTQKKTITREDMEKFFDKNPKSPQYKNVMKFAQGGELPPMDTEYMQKQVQQIVVDRDDRPVVVQVTDIINAQEDLRRVQTLAGLS